MKSNIQIRIDTEMKSEFIRICESQGKIPSKVIRSMIVSYVMNNTGMSLQNNICDDVITATEELIGRNKTGQLVATTKIKIIDVATNKIVATYNRGQPIKKYYMDTDNYEIIAT